MVISIAVFLPIAPAATVLLDLLGVGIGKAALAKEARELILGHGGALGDSLVVTVVGLVGAGHWRGVMLVVRYQNRAEIDAICF